jgi:hypothetical protein
MTTIKNTNNKKFWQDCGENRTVIHCWWECKLVQPQWKTGLRYLKKLKIELAYDPAIPLHRYTQRNVSQVIIKALAHPCLLQYYSQYPSYGNSQDATTDEWIKNVWYLYSMEFYSSTKKNENLSFAGK